LPKHDAELRIKPKFHLARLDTTRHVRRVEPVEFVLSSVSSVLFDKLDTAKMHGLDTSNVSSHVEA